MRLALRRRTTAVAQVPDRDAELAEARAEILRLNLCLSRAVADANRAEQELAAFRLDIRQAHSALVADNNRLRRLAERAGVAA